MELKNYPVGCCIPLSHFAARLLDAIADADEASAYYMLNGFAIQDDAAIPINRLHAAEDNATKE